MTSVHRSGVDWEEDCGCKGGDACLALSCPAFGCFVQVCRVILGSPFIEVVCEDVCCNEVGGGVVGA